MAVYWLDFGQAAHGTDRPSVASFVLAPWANPVAIYPADLGEMMPLLFGLLGMSGLRSFEKSGGWRSACR
jgi:hypothetical protein